MKVEHGQVNPFTATLIGALRRCWRHGSAAEEALWTLRSARIKVAVNGYTRPCSTFIVQSLLT